MIALSEEERAKSGLDSLPKVNREAIYYQYFLDEGGVAPPLETLEAIAEVLNARPAWIAFGSGPMSSRAIADPLRELYLVDGAKSRGFTGEHIAPEDRKAARKGFRAAFNKMRGEARLEPFVDTVHVVFANYLARWMQRRRDEESYPTGRISETAKWRGKKAAEQLDGVIQLARRHGLRDNNYGRPESTAAMIRALGEKMTKENPRSG